MCGIVAAVGKDVTSLVPLVKHRGPDADGVVEKGGVWIGHARLAILDPDPRSDQPFRRGDVVLAWNGELWNFREVRAELEALGERFETAGDTEVVAAALSRWDEGALPRFEGMFAAAWTTGDGVLRLARDRFGEVPLHVDVPGRTAASERRVFGRRPAAWVGPGEVVTLSADAATRRRWWEPEIRWETMELEPAAVILRNRVVDAARERAISDVPVCTLLSGGIDSAAVAWALKAEIPDLVAFTAVMDPGSRDVRAARVCASALGIRLIEVRVPPPSADDLARVVRQIEMPHKAQVEIGWACLHLAARMRAEGFKVTFSGEGSDELWASYGFAYHALAAGADWRSYRRDLFLGQHRKNFARCNKAFLSAGVECRLPFLNTRLAEFALSLKRGAVERRAGDKAVMREAFRGVLPRAIVDRPKLAFQDGLGMKAAAAAAVPDPARFYRAEFATRCGEEVVA